MKIDTTVRFVLLLSSFFLSINWGKAQMEGQVRLTGLTKAVGRLEVYLNGKWGTVCSDLTDDTYNQRLGYGKTVCSQLNHYNRNSAQPVTGTVNDLNKILLENKIATIDVTGGTEQYSMQNLVCGNAFDPSPPSHILWCSYKSGSGCSSHENDLGVVCNKSATNRDSPYIGQIGLNNDNPDEVNKGTLEIYSGNEWGNICYNKFDQGAANSACRQLGYTNAKTFGKTSTQSASTVWLSQVSCGSNSTECLWNCLSDSDHSDLYNNKTKSCGNQQYGTLECVFNTSMRSKVSSPPAGSTRCEIQPYTDTNFSVLKPYTDKTDNSFSVLKPYMDKSFSVLTIVIVVTVFVLLVVIAVVVMTVTICVCCFLPSCYLYKNRTNKIRYTHVSQ